MLKKLRCLRENSMKSWALQSLPHVGPGWDASVGFNGEAEFARPLVGIKLLAHHLPGLSQPKPESQQIISIHSGLPPERGLWPSLQSLMQSRKGNSTSNVEEPFIYNLVKYIFQFETRC